MVGDTVITGSDDWTARLWSVSRGSCDAVLSCHAGPIQCVELSPSNNGIITGWLPLSTLMILCLFNVLQVLLLH